jgi:hypothetical protein
MFRDEPLEMIRHSPAVMCHLGCVHGWPPALELRSLKRQGAIRSPALVENL